MQRVGKPKSWITWGVKTDGFRFRLVHLTGEARHHPPERVGSNKWRHKGETKWCGVADESVVVINSRPVKAGNRLEEKTGRTLHLIAVGYNQPKAVVFAKGRR